VKSSFWFVPHTQNLPLGLGNVERAEKLLTASLLQCIFYWDSTYPPQLREFFDPPATLFDRGTHLKTDMCLTGTRLPITGAWKAAFRLGFALGGCEGAMVVQRFAQGGERTNIVGRTDVAGNTWVRLWAAASHRGPRAAADPNLRVVVLQE